MASSSSNQTVATQMAELIRLEEDLKSEQTKKDWLEESVQEYASRDARIQKLEENETSLKEKLNASLEKNLEYEREIKDLQKEMAEQHNLDQISAMNWAKEKDLLESRNNNLKSNVSAANRTVNSSKKLAGELKVLDAKILEKETEFKSKMKTNEEKLSLLTQAYEGSVDSYDALLKEVKTFGIRLGQGSIDQLRATISSLQKKLEGQRISSDAKRREMIVKLLHENADLEGDIMLLEDQMKGSL